MCLTLTPEVRRAFTSSKRACYIDCPEHGTTIPAHRLERFDGGLRFSVIRGMRRSADRNETYCMQCYARASEITDKAMTQWREVQDAHPNPNKYPPLTAAFDQFRAALTPLPLRVIQLRKPRSENPSPCGTACLNGKKTCDCLACLGACHGAGTCTCQTQPAPARIAVVA